MVVGGRGRDWSPGYVVRGGKGIAAFVEIALETGAVPGLELAAEKSRCRNRDAECPDIVPLDFLKRLSSVC